MNHNPPIATAIIIVIVIASLVGFFYAIKPFFFPKKQERETIHKSARNQSTLIDKRIKK